jgi:hypothetical protein
VIPWRPPVQAWLINHGFGQFAAKYAIVNLQIPSAFLSLIGGATIGRLQHKCWLRHWFLFALSLAFGDDVVLLALGMHPAFFFSAHVTSLTVLWEVLAIFPVSFAATYLGAVRGQHRYAARLAEQFCRNCEYNLFGNTSGRCPECGCEINLQ